LPEIWPGRAYPLGATFDGNGTNFALFSEVAEKVELCLFDEQGAEHRLALEEVDAFSWHAYMPHIGAGQRYGYRVHGPNAPEHGTYAGLAHPAIIQHLVSLGVTAVELMPVHQFVQDHRLVEQGLRNYWGYNTIGFFAPHNEYASSGHRGEQVNEFKWMVRTLHEAGIEVILDVVY